MTLVAEIGDSKDNGLASRAGKEAGRVVEVGVEHTSQHSGRIIEPASSLRGGGAKASDHKNCIFLIYNHQLVVRKIL